MTLNRSIAPVSYQTETLKLPSYNIDKLDNGLNVYQISAGEQPVVKVEFIFDAGTRFENQNGQSFFAVKMLSEGTKTHTSAEIASFFDQFGASLELVHGVDRSGLSVYTLTKHLPAILPMIHSLIYESIFPEKELISIKNIVSQNLKVQQEKTAYIAGQIFKETVFGLKHPAGVMLNDTAIQGISRDKIIAFYNEFWIKNQFKIFISGSFQSADLDLLNTIFGQKPLLKPKLNKLKTPKPAKQAILIEKEGSLQSSIRLGRPMFSRNHPDFFPFIVMNEAFGGYFGSRLMKNIREEKGFTYGISASLVPFTETGYWLIGTDVKREFTQQTLDEIAKEIKIMQTELLDDEELQTVKNYMIGAMAGGLNTPFEVADRVKVMIMNKLPDDFYANYIKNIRSINPTQVQEMAKKYLKNLTEIVVGGK